MGYNKLPDLPIMSLRVANYTSGQHHTILVAYGIVIFLFVDISLKNVNSFFIFSISWTTPVARA